MTIEAAIPSSLQAYVIGIVAAVDSAAAMMLIFAKSAIRRVPWTHAVWPPETSRQKTATARSAILGAYETFSNDKIDIALAPATTASAPNTPSTTVARRS